MNILIFANMQNEQVPIDTVIKYLFSMVGKLECFCIVRCKAKGFYCCIDFMNGAKAEINRLNLLK